ncbi:MAG TPA: hypothetical protein VEW46_25855 [Pyrinomonadaceae bacterium]|nr:hypothetical protein [Pyrinomonadaceae bacterium]
MSDVELETEIRKIIYDDYGVGHQNIDSKEIYDKLVARGIDVRENSMGEVFDSLKKRGLIRGAARLNSDEARKHGAYSIMWVGRHIAV